MEENIRKRNWYLCFDEFRDSRLKKYSTSSLQRKKLNDKSKRNKPIAINI